MVFCLIFNFVGIVYWRGLFCVFCCFVIIYINIYCYLFLRVICWEWVLSFIFVVFCWLLCVFKDNVRIFDNFLFLLVCIWKFYLRWRLKCCVFRREVMIFFFFIWYILLVIVNFLECFKFRLKCKCYFIGI